MDIKKTVNLHSFKKELNITGYNWRVIILTVMFLIGLIIGTMWVKNGNSEISEKIISIFNNIRTSAADDSTSSNFLIVFTFSAVVILTAYLGGLCAIGVPFIALIPAICGIFIGVISSYFYSTYTLKGLGYCVILIFPVTIIISFSMIKCCNESLIMSMNMLRLLSKGGQNSVEFKAYSTKFAIYTVISAFGSLIEAFLYSLFGRLFIF